MKNNYFTKIENKYVFNISLIFWHILIALTTLAIIGCIAGLLYSLIPIQKKQIEKPAYPEKTAYPPAVKVDITELQLEEKKDEVPDQTQSQAQSPSNPTQENQEDFKGKIEYEASLNKLKELIPPSKYTWDNRGTWYYPYGERYWQVYHDERYRQYVVQEYGISDRLSTAYQKSKANTYSDMKSLLDGYIEVFTPMVEDKKAEGLKRLLLNVMEDASRNRIMCSSLIKVVTNISTDADNTYLSTLSNFYQNNPKDGVPFIEYVATIINKFSGNKQAAIVDRLTNSYYSFFKQNLTYQKEATESFLTLIPQIDAELQAKALIQYYKVYLDKNVDREKEITSIENAYQESINQIDLNYTSAVAEADQTYMSKKLKKADLKLKSLSGIGIGIMSIVLIAMVLVFLSIQRSVRKIEEKVTMQTST